VNTVLPPLPAPPAANLVLFSSSQWHWLTSALAAIHAAQEAELQVLGAIINAQETLMATIEELQTKLDALTAADAENAARTSSEMADLAAALAALKPGEPVTQAQLDQIQAVIDRVTARNAALAADDPSQTAPPSA
jgi:chromosome segregation ATPase